MFAFKFDEQKKLVLVEIAGLISSSVVDKLDEELLANASAARRRFGPLRFLMDARSAPVQPADVLGRSKILLELLKGDNDRIAVVVGSSLSMLQAKRVLEHDQLRTFFSMNDAEDWLLADGPSEDSEHERRDSRRRSRKVLGR